MIAGEDDDGDPLPPLPNGRTHWPEFYVLGVAMNLSPRQVDDLSLYEFRCMGNAFRRIHPPADDKPPAMGDDQLANLGIEGFA